jgi:hypothetical protein
MKRIAAIAALLLLCTTAIFSQSLTQTVRGTILDEDSKMPLIGAQVIVLGSDPLLGTASDAQVNFRLDKVPIGRITLQVSYLGYKNAIIPNIVVNSGKETLLNLTMQESAIKMQEVVITEDKNKGTALNDMAMISARSISPEQTNRYAGGFNDPSRTSSPILRASPAPRMAATTSLCAAIPPNTCNGDWKASKSAIPITLPTKAP